MSVSLAVPLCMSTLPSSHIWRFALCPSLSLSLSLSLCLCVCVYVCVCLFVPPHRRPLPLPRSLLRCLSSCVIVSVCLCMHAHNLPTQGAVGIYDSSIRVRHPVAAVVVTRQKNTVALRVRSSTFNTPNVSRDCVGVRECVCVCARTCACVRVRGCVCVRVRVSVQVLQLSERACACFVVGRACVSLVTRLCIFVTRLCTHTDTHPRIRVCTRRVCAHTMQVCAPNGATPAHLELDSNTLCTLPSRLLLPAHTPPPQYPPPSEPRYRNRCLCLCLYVYLRRCLYVYLCLYF